MEGPGLILPQSGGAYDWVESVPWQGCDGTAALSANVHYYTRVRPPKSFHTTQAELFVATAAGNIDVGVVARSGTTMTKLASTGSTAVAGTNAKQMITLAFDWVLGTDYYATIVSDGTPTLARKQIAHANFGATDDCALFKSAAFPLADQSAVTGGNNVLFWVRFL